MPVRLGDLARYIGATLHGDEGCLVAKIATLDTAQAGDVSFLFDRRYRNFLKFTAASAVILHPAELSACPVAALVTADPYLAYARASSLFSPPPAFDAGIHTSACIAPTASVDAAAHVGAFAVVEEGARIGSRAFIGPGCIIGRAVRIGDHSCLSARVTVISGASIGQRCLIHPGAVIGADGFGLARDQGVWMKIPQNASVRIGDDVEIGANTTIDRGTFKDTVIEDGVKLDNLIQIGHNVRIGAHTAIAGCVGVSGSTRIGKRCMIGGGAGITGHIEIADDVVIKGAASVTKSIPVAGVYSSVWPAREDKEWRRKVARFNRLDKEMIQRRNGARGGVNAGNEGESL